MRVLDLFSGIGGFSLGLERAGMTTVAFCEIEPYCQAVLRKHWPNVPIHDDIRTREFIEGEADVVCGGFPCQDISFAGSGAGLAGERSGLWRELLRAIRLVRPKYAVVENVAALLGRGLGDVLGDLAEIGYDAEWNCIPACAVGAPHRRDRVWIVAFASDQGSSRDGRKSQRQGAIQQLGDGNSKDASQVADTKSERRGETRQHLGEHTKRPSECGEILADNTGVINWPRKNNTDVILAHADEPRLQGWISKFLRECGSEWTARTSSPSIPDTDSEPERRPAIAWQEHNQWEFEPDVGRVAHGVPNRVDRLKALGNSVVPQIPELIGRAIVASNKTN